MAQIFDKDEFSKAIRVRRAELNVRLEEAATVLITSKATFQRWEAGIKEPDIEEFCRLCDWLGKPADQFFKTV